MYSVPKMSAFLLTLDILLTLTEKKKKSIQISELPHNLISFDLAMLKIGVLCRHYAWHSWHGATKLCRDNPSDATFLRFVLSWISFRSDWFIRLSAQIVIGQSHNFNFVFCEAFTREAFKKGNKTKFVFPKSSYLNSTMQKLCQSGFIWKVTSSDYEQFPFFPAASGLSRVGWFSRPLAFRSL